MKEYRSKVDWWVYIALAVPPLSAGATAIAGERTHDVSTILIGAGVFVFYVLVIGLVVMPMRYTLDETELRIRAGMLLRFVIPYSRIISVEPTRNPLSSPALSLDRLAVAYKKPNGGYTIVRISPNDRGAFMADLLAASGRHRMDGERLIMK